MKPQVVIIGAGPVGLTMALLLGSYGVQVVVIERRTTIPTEARAVALDDECLRIWQACGLEEAIRTDWEAGEDGAVICAYYDERGRPFLRIRQRAGELGYPHAVVIHQGCIGAKLLDAARRAPSITVLLGHEATGVRQSGDGVVVTSRGQDGRVAPLRAPWLVGCDGGSSIVRDAIGADMEGVTLPESWLIVDIDDDGEGACVDIRCRREGASVTLPLPHGVRRVERMLPSDSNDEWIQNDDALRRSLAEVWPAAGAAAIRNRIVRQFSSRAATRWRSNRIFLAGDAAHVTPPFAGQGMASGIRDAANLSFKLAGVCQGWLGPEVLDSYEVERRPHQRRMDELARRLRRVMAPPSRLEASLTQHGLRLLSRSGLLSTPWLLRGPGIRQVIHDGFLEPSGLAGRYLPQPWVTAPGLGRRRLDSLLGPRMTWLAIGQGRDAGRLPDRFVGPHDSVLVEGRDFDDRERTLQRRFGARSALLVRPDRVVHTHLSRAAIAARLRRSDGCRPANQSGELRPSSAARPRRSSASGVCRTAPM